MEILSANNDLKTSPLSEPEALSQQIYSVSMKETNKEISIKSVCLKPCIELSLFSAQCKQYIWTTFSYAIMR